MNLFLSIPMPLRLAGLFAVGCCVGSLINWAAYRLAFHARSISPWSAPLPKAPLRRPGDRVPVFGWLGLRREVALHGSGFWIRPMLVEFACGLGLASLYWWEVGQLALLPIDLPPAAATLAMPMVHAQFVCHVVLIGLLLAGSLIDLDERTIPDAITMPGTLFGLVVASVYPCSLLTDWIKILPGKLDVSFMQLASPNVWPASLEGFPRAWPLALGLGCWWLWCVALMPRTWYTRHGVIRAIQLCSIRLWRESITWWLAGLGVLGSIGIAGVWWFVGGLHWVGLLSALVGMAAAGGLVWLVRIIGTAALAREAMGFGDVTLMAMLGAMLGWQACLIIFFLAPFAGLVIGVIGLILGRGDAIPYGPFLCLAAVAVVVRWEAFWNWAAGVFRLGWIVPGAMAVCLVLMGIMLGFWRLAREAIQALKTRRS